MQIDAGRPKGNAPPTSFGIGNAGMGLSGETLQTIRPAGALRQEPAGSVTRR